MKNKLSLEETIELLSKRYILAAVSTTCKDVFYVKEYKNKYIFFNENIKFRLDKEQFSDCFFQYKFYLIKDTNCIEINQEFDPLTMKQ